MKNIEYITNSDRLLNELKKQSTLFDLNRFYSSKNICNPLYKGAIQIITPKLALSFFANDSHKLATENVYKVLYGDRRGFTSEIWQEDICKKENVLFQFSLSSFSLAWFPERITQFQLKKTMCNLILINEINKKALSGDIKLSRLFSKHLIDGEERYITVETNVFDDNDDILTLQSAIPVIKKRIYVPKK